MSAAELLDPYGYYCKPCSRIHEKRTTRPADCVEGHPACSWGTHRECWVGRP